MSIYKKLSDIQKELFVPKVNNNDFGRYSYRSCEDILKKVKPILESNNCTMFIDNELIQVGNRNYTNAKVTLVDLESGETITVSAQAREEETKKGMDGSQISGASSSYARKYALAGLFCIDNEKDSDATNDGSGTVDSVMDRTALISDINKILMKMDDGKAVFEKIKTKFKIESLSSSSVETLQKIKGELDGK